MKGKKTRRTGKPPKEVPNPLDTIAGRIIPLVESFWLAVGRATGKESVEPTLSACLPPWCHKIADQFAKTILKSPLSLEPHGKFDVRNFGRMIGFFLRAGVFIFKEVEPTLRSEGLLNLSKNDEAKIESFSGIELLFPVASKKFNLPIKNRNQLLHQAEKYGEARVLTLMEAIKTLLLHLWGQSIEEQHEFLCGIPQGFIGFLDPSGEFTGDRGRTKLNIALLAMWPEIVVLQKTEPPKSRRDLQRWLIVEKRVAMSNDAEWFDHVCDEIGLAMKGVGRKTKTGN